MKLRTTLVAAAVATLVAAPAAFAHVEVSPEAVPADSDAELTFHAPNEKSIPFVKLAIQLPPGLDEVTFQPKQGWTGTLTKRTVTWSGGKVEPDQFDEFKIVAHVPNKPGTELVFPAVQNYADGTTVHWIGAPTSDTPAPRVTLEAAESETATTTTSSSNDSSDGHDSLAIGLAIAGIALGLVALGVSLMRRRTA
jgi:uncharacterized protein YcnI